MESSTREGGILNRTRGICLRCICELPLFLSLFRMRVYNSGMVDTYVHFLEMFVWRTALRQRSRMDGRKGKPQMSPLSFPLQLRFLDFRHRSSLVYRCLPAIVWKAELESLHSPDSRGSLAPSTAPGRASPRECHVYYEDILKETNVPAKTCPVQKRTSYRSEMHMSKLGSGSHSLYCRCRISSTCLSLSFFLFTSFLGLLPFRLLGSTVCTSTVERRGGVSSRLR